jgi:hypothetical protein
MTLIPLPPYLTVWTPQVGLPDDPYSSHPRPDSVELMQVGLPAGPCSPHPLVRYLTVWSSCRWVYLLDSAPPSSTTVKSCNFVRVFA